MSDLARRLGRLKILYQAGGETLPLRYLIAALPPLSAAAHERFDAWRAELEARPTPGPPTDPDEYARQERISDIDMAEAVLRIVPSDMVITASACAGLLVHAYFLWDEERYGRDYAWRHQRRHGEFLSALEPRFEVSG
jgi:hypothetical protein